MKYKQLVKHLEKLGFLWTDTTYDGDDIYSDKDIAETYMKFWNRLPTIQKEMVLVQSIKEIRK